AEEREGAPDSPLFTMDGDVVGTPCYMPPEQGRGEIERLSPRSDVYSIGAMIYHLLAHRMPFVPPDGRITNRTVLSRLLDGPPAGLASIRRDIPAELVAICEKAMEREPQGRYRDTLALAEDLRAYLEHRVVKAYQTGAVAELRKWVERNKGLAASIAAALLLLVAGLTASLAFKARSDRNAEIAGANEERAKVNERRALAGEALAKSEKERAEANEKRAIENERLATERADDVLRLSALQDLDDRIAEADRLWPAHPENVARFVGWLDRAQGLVEGIPQHEKRLADLRSRAIHWTEEDRAKHRASHPRLPELEKAKGRLEFHRRLKAALESGAPKSDPTP
ncbi:MAG: serine/threonine protein kinase, partial [Planctomycetota bacterium]